MPKHAQADADDHRDRDAAGGYDQQGGAGTKQACKAEKA